MSLLEHPHDDWAVYLIGAFFALFLKWHNWVSHGEAAGKSRWESTKEWFSLRERPDQVSWAVTISVVWLVGACYINKIQFLWDWFQHIPVHKPIAFFFGTSVEYIVPTVSKWLLAKLPIGGNP